METYFFHYKTTSGPCKEGPYTLDQVLARKLEFGHFPTCEPRIEIEEKKNAA